MHGQDYNLCVWNCVSNLARCLKPGFDDCVEVENGIGALDKARRLSLNLAVLAFSLPDVSGYQSAQELRAIKPELPIFMLTTEYTPNIEKMALASGIVAVFSKRDDLETLIANARAVCGIE